MADSTESTGPTKVFISYSHDSEEHALRVRRLSDRLRADGIDCRIDQYEVAPPEGWRRWMDQRIAWADFVLVVCSETYHRRARGEEVPGRGMGATYEASQLLDLLYEAGMRNERTIPLLLEGATVDDIPQPLRAYTRYHLDQADDATGGPQYQALYRHLTGQPRIVAPELGSIRQLDPEPSAWVGGEKSKDEIEGPPRPSGFGKLAGGFLAVVVAVAAFFQLASGASPGDPTVEPPSQEHEDLRGVFITKNAERFAGRLALSVQQTNGTWRQVSSEYRFRTGDRFRFEVETGAEATLFVFHQPPGGEVDELWPAATGDANRLTPRQPVLVPPKPKTFEMDGSLGEERFFVAIADPGTAAQRQGPESLASLVKRGLGPPEDRRGVRIVDTEPWLYFEPDEDSAYLAAVAFQLVHGN